MNRDTMNLYLGGDLIEFLKTLAQIDDRKVSYLVRKACQEYYKEEIKGFSEAREVEA